MALRLRDDLHWCNCSGQAVFLDLKTGRYFLLSKAANRAFLHIAEEEVQPEDESLLAKLISRGLLIEDGGCASIQLPPSIETPTCDFASESSQRTSLIHLGRQLASELCWGWTLRSRSIGKVIERAACHPCMKVHAPREQHRALRGIVAGAYLCSFVSRAHDRCLVRALAVKSLCNKNGIKTKLVFGVNANPFAAHCWVQLGRAVLVGGFEQARLYTPILVVE